MENMATGQRFFAFRPWVLFQGDHTHVQILNPNNIIQSCNFPENTKTCPQSMEFIPCDGELILFPSWLMHNTCPNVTDEERISVAFNIDLEIE